MQRLLVFLLFAVLFSSCGGDKHAKSVVYQRDSALVFEYIKKGNEQYALKASLTNFNKSLEFFDSAMQIAHQNGDTLLLAMGMYALGRAYDAINRNPQKTIDYFSEAANLFATIPGKKVNYLYIKQLKAHSYDKVKDSANCIKVLEELYGEIASLNDSVKNEVSFFIPEMALISSEVKNYTLADSILTHLTQRAKIANDSESYDYLNHFYLTRARIDVYQNKKSNSPYLDSLETVFASSKNLSDSIYYSFQLTELFTKAQNTPKESYYLKWHNTLYNRFNSPEVIKETQEKLSEIELEAIKMQQKAALEKATIKKQYFIMLSILLVVITFLALYLIRNIKSIKQKQKEVQWANKQLEEKNLQNVLLNKEIHHRVKNNLQMIMSLVNMQENNSDSEEVKNHMQAISLRIESIAGLHQQLMEQSGTVDLKKYIQQLINNLSAILADGKKVITHLEVEPISVPQKISFPLGLIINEWITNSVKYAKPENDVLEIHVIITNGNNLIKVSYEDNGAAKHTEPVKKSLGLEIINILASQLEADLQTDTDNIFKYKLNIPISNG